MKLNLSSDDINLLVYRYLLENGYCHSAFAFNKECDITKNPNYCSHADKVPPNALVSFMQKAMIYVYLEYHTDEYTGEQVTCEEPFSFFRKHTCFRKVGQTHGLPLSQSSFLMKDANNVNADDNDLINNETQDAHHAACRDVNKDESIYHENASAVDLFQPIYVGPPQRRLADRWQLFGYYKLYEYKDVRSHATIWFNPVYEGYICKRVQNGPATVFKIPQNESASNARATAACEIITPMVTLKSTDENTGITTAVQWRADGQILCTGHLDGNVNIWSLDGLRLFNNKVSKDPITVVSFSGNKLSWEHGTNEMSPFVIAIGTSKAAVILYKFDGRYEYVNQYKHQSGMVTDMDWRSDTVVASASSDGSVFLYNITTNTTLAVPDIAEGNIAYLEWDPEGKYLAIVDSSSIVKIYKTTDGPTRGRLFELKGHNGNVIHGQWQHCPDEKITHRLYTIGMDKCIFVWDVAAECVLNSLSLEQVPTSICNNVGGSLMALGTYGNVIKVYALPTLTLLCSFYEQNVATHITWSADSALLGYNVYNLQRSIVVPINSLSSYQTE